MWSFHGSSRRWRTTSVMAIIAVCLLASPYVNGMGPVQPVYDEKRVDRTVEPILDEDFTTTTADEQHPGCDHYRHGLLALTLCTSYYPTVKRGKPYVQIMGSLTNEGSVDICNLTLSVDGGLHDAVARSPAWLPTYPRDESFKAGTYLSFSAVLPATPEGRGSYPAVDVYRSFFACDAGLTALPEELVVPAPGSITHHVHELRMDKAGGGHSSPAVMPQSRKALWKDRMMQAAGPHSACLTPCLGSLHENECSAAAVLLHSNCSATCPPSVHEWATRSCHEAGCGAATCHGPRAISSPAPRTTTPAAALASLVVLVTAVLGTGTSYN